jgi:hypothetical protein
MPAFTWIALGVFVLTVLSGAILASVRTLAAWRAFQSLRRSVAGGLDDMVRKVADVEERLAHAGRTATRLDEATARLRDSLATASVLASAAGEARAPIERIRGVIPRK